LVIVALELDVVSPSVMPLKESVEAACFELCKWSIQLSLNCADIIIKLLFSAILGVGRRKKKVTQHWI
jgi:hypothetical protein